MESLKRPDGKYNYKVLFAKYYGEILDELEKGGGVASAVRRVENCVRRDEKIEGSLVFDLANFSQRISKDTRLNHLLERNKTGEEMNSQEWADVIRKDLEEDNSASFQSIASKHGLTVGRVANYIKRYIRNEDKK